MSIIDLRPARKHAPTVRLISLSAEPFVQKSYRDCPPLIRETVGRLALQRECWALTRLESSGHAPRLIARPDRFTIETEYVAGTPLEKLEPAQVDPDRLLDQGRSLLETLKEAGIVHGDLGHDFWQSLGRESNLIWTVDERLVAIDFAGSLPLRLPSRPLRNLSSALHRHDQLLLSKIGHHFCPQRLGRTAEVDWPVGLWDLLRFLGKV